MLQELQFLHKRTVAHKGTALLVLDQGLLAHVSGLLSEYRLFL